MKSKTRAVFGSAPVHFPHEAAYRYATRMLGSDPLQTPAAVVTVRTVAEVQFAIRAAHQLGFSAVAQSHAQMQALPVGDNAILIDTLAMDHVGIYRDIASAGPGAAWTRIAAAASNHLRLGLTRSERITASPNDHSSGWLKRIGTVPGASLIAVEYVDDSGNVCRATADHNAGLLEAYRAGEGGFVATHVDIRLPQPCAIGHARR